MILNPEKEVYLGKEVKMRGFHSCYPITGNKKQGTYIIDVCYAHSVQFKHPINMSTIALMKSPAVKLHEHTQPI